MTTQPDYKKAEMWAIVVRHDSGQKDGLVIAADVAEHYQLKTLACEFPTDQSNISGFIHKDKTTGQITIYVNHLEPATRKNFTIAHELGHYFLGHMENENYEVLFRGPIAYSNNSVIEQEANHFALNLLISEKTLKQYLHLYPSAPNGLLCGFYGVPEDAIALRRQGLKI